MGDISYRGRFAPSPTGPLHLGSLTAALGSWLMARVSGGEWLLRIEDLDPPREAAGVAEAQIRMLAAFGLVSDRPAVWQSRRSEYYQAALQKLSDDGNVFACRCTRSDLAPTGGVHRRCVERPSGARSAYRLRPPPGVITFNDRIRGPYAQDVADQSGDVVLKRADGYWAYQLAVVVDDALQEITDVVRGADLLDSTPRQIVLQGLLGHPSPRYAHLPVILQPDGVKLSKSLRGAALDVRNPLPALRLAYQWLGQDPRELDEQRHPEHALRCAIAAFRPELIPARDHHLPSK